MNYTMDERIDIGRRFFTQELTHKEAMKKYQIGHSSVDNYVRMYKQSIGIAVRKFSTSSKNDGMPDMEAYMSMTKEELINELIKAKANELRAKKGYEIVMGLSGMVYNI